MKYAFLEGQTVQVSHKDQALLFDVVQFQNTGMELKDELFNEINGFISTLPEDSQDRIFNAYVQIRSLMKLRSRKSEIEMPIAEQVKIIYDEITEVELARWFRYNRRIIYPQTCPESHDPDDQLPQKTYLRSDYLALAIYAVRLRPLIPIWGEYVRLVKVETGNNLKEYVSFRILIKTNLMTVEAYQRLVAYVESIKNFKVFIANPAVSVDESLSTSELPNWLMYITIFRRLTCGSIDTDEKNTHLASSVHTYVSSVIERSESRFGQFRWKKTPHERNGDEGDKPITDSYRSRQEVSIGDMAIDTVYLSQRADVVLGIDDTVSFELIDAMIGEKLEGEIKSFQVILSQLVLSLVMSPLSINTMLARREQGISVDAVRVLHNPLHDAIVIVKAVLWHWGYHSLSLLMTAVELHEDDHPEESIDQISRAMVTELNHYFPYPLKNGTNDRQRNVAYLEITELSKTIGQKAWDVKIPSIAEAEGRKYLDRLGKMFTPSDLQEQLAKLVIEVARRKEQLGVTKIIGVNSDE